MNKEPKYVVRCFNSNEYLSDDGGFYDKSYAKEFDTLDEALKAEHKHDWLMTVVIETIHKI